MSRSSSSFPSGISKNTTIINPFESITETFFHKRTSEFNKTGLTEYGNELIYNYQYLNKLIDFTANVLRALPILRHWIGPPFEHEEQLNKLLAQQKAATSYKEWFDVSVRLDNFLQKNEWKLEEECSLYDYKLIKKHLAFLREARSNKDYATLLYLVRTTWTRNLGNMGNVNLYRHSHVGTKKLIEEYIEECESILDDLTSLDCPLDDRYVLSMLLQTRKAIGRTALVLSGGGCFGLFHIGVLANLLELNLLPKIISGSSAGAIIASILCVQSQEETLALISTIETKRFDIFEENNNKEPFLVNLARFLKYGTWFDNKYLQQTMFEFLGDLTFRESYNRTGRILNITVSPASIHEQPTLLNYLTSPNVLIWSAVCASCSLPGVFPSSTIYEKNSDGLRQEWNHASVKFVDGSVDNDLPITRLSEMFNVDHIIACQCNPHVVPLLKMSVACVGGEIENEYSAKFKHILNKCYDLCSLELMHYFEVMSELGICKNVATKLRSVLAQQYSGDITILPDTRLTEIGKLLANPSPKFLLDATVRGARATWPKITLIKNHCTVEFALDKAISEIRSRLISTRLSSAMPLVVSPPPPQPQADMDNMKVTSLLSTISNVPGSGTGGSAIKNNNNNSRYHQRHRSDSMNVASLSSGTYYPPARPQQQSRVVRYKNSMPLMYGSGSKMERQPKMKRRRRTLSGGGSTASGDAVVGSNSGSSTGTNAGYQQAPAMNSNLSSPMIDTRARYRSLPASNTVTEPPSPYQIRKEFVGANYRIPSSTSISNTNGNANGNGNKKTYSPKARKQKLPVSIPTITSGFFKNNHVPKVMQQQKQGKTNTSSATTNSSAAPAPPVDPGDDDIIIRKITGRYNPPRFHYHNDTDDDDDDDDTTDDDNYDKTNNDNNNEDDDDDGDETEKEEQFANNNNNNNTTDNEDYNVIEGNGNTEGNDDPLEDGYEDEDSTYTLSGATTPFR